MQCVFCVILKFFTFICKSLIKTFKFYVLEANIDLNYSFAFKTLFKLNDLVIKYQLDSKNQCLVIKNWYFVEYFNENAEYSGFLKYLW